MILPKLKPFFDKFCHFNLIEITYNWSIYHDLVIKCTDHYLKKYCLSKHVIFYHFSMFLFTILTFLSHTDLLVKSYYIACGCHLELTLYCWTVKWLFLVPNLQTFNEKYVCLIRFKHGWCTPYPHKKMIFFVEADLNLGIWSV